MSQPNRSRSKPLNRRAALAHVGVGAMAAGLGSNVSHAAAQDAGNDLANHPLVGTWAVTTPGGVVPQTHGADGSVVAAFPPNYVDPGLGLTFQGTALGRWEPDGERIGRFTALQALSDANGVYVGTFLLAAGVEVSEDGQTWSSADLDARIILRDAANTILLDQALPAEPMVTATRMGATADSVVLPEMTAMAATPQP